VTGITVFNQNNNYYFGVVGVLGMVNCVNGQLINDEGDDAFDYAQARNQEKKSYFDDVKISNYSNIKINIESFTNSINGYRKEIINNLSKHIKHDVVYMQLPLKGFDGIPFYGYFTEPSNIFGQGGMSIQMTQYRYDIATYQNGNLYVITDIVSQITVSPAGGHHVRFYDTRMHANISNMNVIGQSHLNSNTSSSYTLSGGISFNGPVITGQLGSSTTNHYNTDSQNIQNDFFAQKYKNWNVAPVVNTTSSWSIEPAIRIINEDAGSYMSGAFTSVRDMAVAIVVPYFLSNPVEIGGWW
jgi:hypothetical protein